MVAYLPDVLFTFVTIAVGVTLADCGIRFRNAWAIAKRELTSTQADLSFEHQLIGGNIVALRKSARSDPRQPTALLSARHLPHAVAA